RWRFSDRFEGKTAFCSREIDFEVVEPVRKGVRFLRVFGQVLSLVSCSWVETGSVWNFFLSGNAKLVLFEEKPALWLPGASGMLPKRFRWFLLPPRHRDTERTKDSRRGAEGAGVNRTLRIIFPPTFFAP